MMNQLARDCKGESEGNLGVAQQQGVPNLDGENHESFFAIKCLNLRINSQISKITHIIEKMDHL